MESLVFNIATLGICFTALVIFRKSDKTNNKINKLQRFAKKIMEDFEVMVHEKRREFMDTSIDFGVLDKKARGLMADIVKYSQDFDARISSLQGEMAKIGLIEQELKRIGESSVEVNRQIEFIADARLQFKEDQKKIQRLGEGLAVLERDSMAFMETVESRMNEKTVKMFGAMQEKVETFDSMIQNLEATANHRIEEKVANISDNYKRNLQQMEDSIVRAGEIALEKVNMDVDKLEGRVRDLEKNSNQHYITVSQKVEEKYQLIRDEINSFEKSFRERREEFSREMDQQMHSFESRWEEQQVRLMHKHDDLDENINNQFETFQEKLSMTWQEFETRKSDFIKKLDSEAKIHDDKLASVESRMANSEKRMIQSFENQVRRVNDEISQLNLESVTKRDELVQELRMESEKALQSMENFNSRFSDAEIKYNQKISDAIVRLNEEMNNYQKVFQKSQEENDARGQDRISELYRRLSVFEQNFEESKKTLLIEAADKVDKLFDLYLKRQEEGQQKLNGKMSTVEENLVQVSNRLQDRFLQFQEAMDSEQERLREFGQKMRIENEEEQKRILDSAREDSRRLEEHVRVIWQEIQRYEEETALFKRTDSMKAELQDALRYFAEKLETIKQDNREIEKALANIQDLKTLRRDIETELSILQKKKGQVDGFEEDLKEAINLSHAVLEKAESLAHIDQRFNDMNDTIHGLQNILDGVQKESKDFLAQKSEIKKSLEVVSHTDTNIKKIFQRMSDLGTYLEKVERKSLDLKAYLDDVNNKSLVLTSREEEIREVQRRFEQMDSLLEDINIRSQSVTTMNQRLEKMRQWMLEAEKRLEDLNAKASEKIRSFAEFMNAVENTPDALVKKVRDDKPESAYRDDQKKHQAILKLHQLGWPTREISEKMAIQESEVNMIVKSMANMPA